MAAAISNIRDIIRNHLLLSLVLLELLIGLPGYLISMHTYVSNNTILLSDQQSLSLISTPGGTFTFGLRINGSVDGEWASPQGLRFQLDGFSSPLTIIAPQAQGWSDTVFTFSDQANLTFVISGNLTIPPSISSPGDHLLSGTINGTFVYPEEYSCSQGPFGLPSTGGTGCFQNQSTTIDIPVQLQLVSPGELLWSSGQLAFYIFAVLELLCSIALLLLSLLILFRALRTAIRDRRSSNFSRASGCLMFLAFLFAGFIAFICYSLLSPPVIPPYATNTNVLPYPALVTGPGQPLAVLISLTTFLTLIALVIDYRKRLED